VWVLWSVPCCVRACVCVCVTVCVCVCGHDVEALLIIGSGVAIKRDMHAREPLRSTRCDCGKFLLVRIMHTIVQILYH
jgi:hypothetical protein